MRLNKEIKESFIVAEQERNQFEFEIKTLEDVIYLINIIGTFDKKKDCCRRRGTIDDSQGTSY